MTRDLCMFLFFTLQMTWEFAFFWVCPTTPMSSAGTINAISALEETSRMLFLKARGARTKSICAKRSGDHGALNPFSQNLSLKVHVLCV